MLINKNSFICQIQLIDILKRIDT